MIGTTTDVALILNTASSPLPIINTPIPVAGFYVVGGSLLAAVYCYLHFYLQRMWRTLATLPAVFPDGTTLDDKSDPWLLTNLVRVYFQRLKLNGHALKRLETQVSIALAWGLVPFTLFALWGRYLPSHDWVGTCWLVFLPSFTLVFGWNCFRFARAALRGDAPPAAGPGIVGTWRELRVLSWAGRTFWCLTILTPWVLIALSYAAFYVNPRDDFWAAKALNGLRLVGIRTYADLREADVAVRPDGWTGKDWDKIKQVDLRGRNLAFADGTGAFFANADLRGTSLQNAGLRFAEFQDANFHSANLKGADLVGADLEGAILSGANFQGARLDGADLRGTNLEGVNLQSATLSGANLQAANVLYSTRAPTLAESAPYTGGFLPVGGFDDGPRLQGAYLSGALLQGADLSRTSLQGADLSGANLQGASLAAANLQGANLSDAWLQGANLFGSDLQGADFRGAALWRARVQTAEWGEASWALADLRGTTVERMTDPDIDEVVAGVSEAIADEGQKREISERLTAQLRAEDRPARPEFPAVWQSQPNVMFNARDPEGEPFSWGTRKWATEQAYDEDLAKFLGDLACGSDVPEAQTYGLARRALDTEPDRQWPRLFAARLIGPDCLPAETLADDLRRQLEQLSALGSVPN